MAATEAAAPETILDTDAAALKKAEANRKKREKQKAKKAAVKEAVDISNEAPGGRWQLGKLPGNRAERRSSGADRGLGVFSLQPIAEGDVIAQAKPGLSVVFDQAADLVCSFCYDQIPLKDQSTEHALSLKTGGGSFGIVLDDLTPPGSEQAVATVTRVVNDSPNKGIVRVGDRLVSVQGTAVSGGHAAAVPMLKAGLEGSATEVAVVIARPAALHCQGCKKLSVCQKCAGEGRLQWHNAECAVFQALPDGAKQGDTSIVRMLLRNKVSTAPSGPGEWSAEKEPIGLLDSLQGNAVNLPVDQVDKLAKLTGNRFETAANLIYQVRTNACQISRGGAKVGCALSVLMGWHNHDCSPNAAAVVGPSGEVAVTALKDIKEGEEITISYVDVKDDIDKRKKTLLQHYGFECKCNRCQDEARTELKQRMKEANLYRAGQRR